MRRFFALLSIAVAFSMVATAQEMRFVDATELGIHGYTKKSDKSPYYRYDYTPYEGFNKTVISHSKKSTGLYVTFKSNSTRIWASWENAPRRMGDNMTGIVQHGLDLYMKVDGEWKFIAVGRVNTLPEKNKRTRTIIKNLPEGEKEFLLYLPIWCELKSLNIGVEKGATIEGLPSPFRHKVIVHGSSITHGASASRSGMTYPAQMSRNLGIDFVNFGFSGECKMQPQFLEFLKGCETDAFIFDAFSNPNAKMIEERLEGFVEGLTEAHPGKPLIFLQTPLGISYDSRENNSRRDKQSVAREILKRLMKRHKDLYLLEVENVIGEDGYVDNSHPTDLGFKRLVDAYQPKIAKILKKYGIKGN